MKAKDLTSTKDNLSSAITFFVCGGIGIILMILNDIGIIKIVTKDAPSFLFINIVLGLLFIGFIAIGVWSLKYSNKIKPRLKLRIRKPPMYLTGWKTT